MRQKGQWTPESEKSLPSCPLLAWDPRGGKGRGRTFVPSGTGVPCPWRAIPTFLLLPTAADPGHPKAQCHPHSCSPPRTPGAFTAPDHPHWPLGDSALLPKQKSDTNPTVLISHPSNPCDVSGVLPGRIWLIAKELWVLCSWLWGSLQGWTCKRSLSWRFRYPAKFAAEFCSSLWERCFTKNAEKSYHAIPL